MFAVSQFAAFPEVALAESEPPTLPELSFFQSADPPNPSVALIARPPALRERFVLPDFAFMLHTLAGADQDHTQKVRFELFDDVVIEATTAVFELRDNGFSWIGAGRTPEGKDQEVVLTVYDPLPTEVGAKQSVIASFWSEGRRFRLQRVADQVHSIIEIDQGALRDEIDYSHGSSETSTSAGEEDSYSEPSLPPSIPGEAPSAEQVVNTATELINDPGVYAADSMHTPGSVHTAAVAPSGGFVDILAVYTLRAAAAGEVIANVLHQIDLANSANAKSGLSFRFRLVRAEQIDYTETTSNIDTDLNRLTDGNINGVHAMRDNYGADLVTLVGWGYQNWCGSANLPGAFSVVSLGPACDDLTAAHEMGHNAGLRHNWAQDSTPGYNHGFINTTGGFRTIMAYNSSACPGGQCTHIPHWSDPDNNYNGLATGVPEGQPNPADNARALYDNYAGVQGLRSHPNDPIGAFDGATPVGGGVHIGGWAIDFDTNDAINVHVYDGGNLVGGYTANKPRPDVANVFPGFGDTQDERAAHGFDELIQLSEGPHTVCVYGINVGPGNNSLLPSCKYIIVRVNPFGSYDGIGRVPGGIRVSGWAIDPDTDAPISVHFYLDGTISRGDTASRERQDVAASNPGYGPNHGYDTIVPVTSGGTHEVCIYAINVGPGVNVPLGCRSVYVGVDPFGAYDGIGRVPGGIRVSGWAIDPDTDAPITVHFYLDGTVVRGDTASRERQDVAASNPGYGPNHGYDTIVPVTSGGTHEVCIYAINVGPGANILLGCRSVYVSVSPFGAFDMANRTSVATIRVAGWAIDPDTANPITVEVSIDGLPPIEITADQTRSDIGAAYPDYGPNHGYESASIPALPGPHTVCITAVNVGVGSNQLLGCRAVE